MVTTARIQNQTTTSPTTRTPTSPVLTPQDLMPPGEEGQRFRALSKDKKELRRGRWIVVVDDCDATLRKIAKELKADFPESEVVLFNDPLKALEAMRTEKFDVAVIDLYMDKMQGLEISQRLAKEGKFIPTVYNTAFTMMDETVGNVVRQFDQFSTTKGMGGYIHESRDNLNKTGNMGLNRPIIVHSKFDDPEPGSLANFIDFTLVLKDEVSTGDTIDFLSKFQPVVMGKNLPKAVVHKTAEEARNFSEDATKLVRHMREQFENIEETPWWVNNGERITKALEGLSKITYKDTYSENPAETHKNLHAIRTWMGEIRGPPKELSANEFGEYSSDQSFREFADAWRGMGQESYGKIRSLFNSYLDHESPILDVPTAVSDIVGENISVDSDSEFFGINTGVHNKRFIEDTIRSVVSFSRKRVERDPDSKMNITIRHAKDVGNAEFLTEDERAELQRLGPEAMLIEIADTALTSPNLGQEYEQLSEALGPDLGIRTMNQNKLGILRWTHDSAKGKGFKFRIILKARGGEEEFGQAQKIVTLINHKGEIIEVPRDEFSEEARRANKDLEPESRVYHNGYLWMVKPDILDFIDQYDNPHYIPFDELTTDAQKFFIPSPPGSRIYYGGKEFLVAEDGREILTKDHYGDKLERLKKKFPEVNAVEVQSSTSRGSFKAYRNIGEGKNITFLGGMPEDMAKSPTNKGVICKLGDEIFVITPSDTHGPPEECRQMLVDYFDQYGNEKVSGEQGARSVTEIIPFFSHPEMDNTILATQGFGLQQHRDLYKILRQLGEDDKIAVWPEYTHQGRLQPSDLKWETDLSLAEKGTPPWVGALRTANPEGLGEVTVVGKKFDELGSYDNPIIYVAGGKQIIATEDGGSHLESAQMLSEHAEKTDLPHVVGEPFNPHRIESDHVRVKIEYEGDKKVYLLDSKKLDFRTEQASRVLVKLGVPVDDIVL
ncbi:MAG: response regulator, partial [Candidatus Altiarchaeota archaeon]